MAREDKRKVEVVVEYLDESLDQGAHQFARELKEKYELDAAG
ncbi:hypothetical protein ATKI12_2878 [Kitasatospora sp. Ki12]